MPLEGLEVFHTDESIALDPTTHSAVELFVQRARQLQPDFTDQPSNVAHVIRICRLVGGMPLGIELAVSWLRSLPLAEIADELQTGLDVLETSMRNV